KRGVLGKEKLRIAKDGFPSLIYDNNRNVKSLEGIEKFQNLENLILYPGKIRTLKPILELKHLEYIYIKKNPISDFEILGQIGTLK
ncbi:MAG: hypothetical protein GX259_10055, partial [Bacteroidales bacterium]|nr:hypothetical protein [Bacteroidales bacterium]